MGCYETSSKHSAFRTPSCRMIDGVQDRLLQGPLRVFLGRQEAIEFRSGGWGGFHGSTTSWYPSIRGPKDHTNMRILQATTSALPLLGPIVGFVDALTWAACWPSGARMVSILAPVLGLESWKGLQETPCLLELLNTHAERIHYQHHFEACLRYMVLWLVWEYLTTIVLLVIIAATITWTPKVCPLMAFENPRPITKAYGSFQLAALNADPK